ncbi:MAG: phosphate ABC transporter ATP-binding protein [Methanothrix sp.]|jgi:tungstate transport system ATP-binding protein|nr:phosphate ABC transporter ATP-binding protein [Methanothrix sp.]
MALLEISSLGKSYGKAEVLKGIDLTVERGEILGLIGPTGSGKTTLLRLVNLLDEPSTGSILFEDREVSGRPEREKLSMRRKMAMVFQKPVMFKASVEENVSFGLRMRGRVDAKEMRGQTKEALAAMGLSGYESRDANTLSGGEMQRIALARAWVLQPELLLLDEPTANLDPGSAASIDRLLHSLADSRTAVILATHNMQQCRKLADRVAVLQAGRLVAVGKSEEITLPW